MQILHHQPHKKLGIPAGMISLVFLPLLCLAWLYFHGAFEKRSSLDVVFLDDDYNKRVSPALQLPLKKDYLVIEITGNNFEDKVSLEYAKLMLKRWKIERDDQHGIRIHFGEKAKYWAFVEAFNVFKEIGLNSFVPYKDQIYAHWQFHSLPKDTSIKPVPCAGITFYRDTFDVPKPALLEKTLLFLKEFWAPVVLFFAMIIFVIIRTIHSHRRSQHSDHLL